MNVQRLTLDLDKSSVSRGRVTIAQCDHDGTTVEAEIYDNGIALDTSGLSAYLVMRLPDGRHYYRVPATLDGHVATALVDEAYAATVVGTTEIAYFELVGSGEVVYSTSRFGVRVLPSATADATVPETWDGEVERLIQQLDDAIDTATDAANVANAAAANANATADGVESRVQEMAQDAAETATADAEQRIQDAIDAMGDISELAVPLMSKDIRGGAKLEEHGGLVLRDEKLGIGSLVQESDGAVRGGIAGLTAEGHAEQLSTTGKNLLPNTTASQTVNGITLKTNADRSIVINGTATATVFFDIGIAPSLVNGQTYTLSANNPVANSGVILKAFNDAGTPESTDNIKCYSIRLAKVNQTGTGAYISSDAEVANATACVIRVASGTTLSNFIIRPQLELGSTATEYEPYTGGAPSPSPEFPQTIEVVSGRNLLENTATSQTINGVTFTVNDDKSITVNGTATGNVFMDITSSLELAAGTYMLSGSPSGGANDTYRFDLRTSSGGVIQEQYGTPVLISISSSQLLKCVIRIQSGFTCNNLTFYPQLTLGSTPQPYVPYGHVGMEARDPDTDELISCTPIPLPSRGWVGSLPDGTADVLTLDGAGKCKWKLKDEEVVFDGDETWVIENSGTRARINVENLKPIPLNSSIINAYSSHFIPVNVVTTWNASSVGFSGVAALSQIAFTDGTGSMTLDAWKTWLSQNPVIVLYPLSTPVTEECGYIEDWPTDIPEDAVISIPELDAVNIEYFIGSTVTELARQWYARAYAEIGQAVVDLAQRVSALES